MFWLLALFLLHTVNCQTYNVSGLNGEIRSPNYPNKYPDNTKMRWVIRGDGLELFLKFKPNFDLENWDSYCMDYVRVMDISTLGVQPCDGRVAPINNYVFCGDDAPDMLDIKASSVIVEFCTDFAVGEAGFEMDWAAKGHPPTTIPPTTIPPAGACGVQAPGYEPIDVDGTKIVGGEHAKPHSWPWQVSMMGDFGGGWVNYCGGSVVNENFIVTAAHCFAELDPSQWDILYLKLGADNRGNDGNANEPTQQVVRIQNAWVNPNYDGAATSHDVCVLKVSEPIVFNDYVRPVCLPSADDTVPAGTNVVVTGWGTTSESGSEPEVLEQVVVPVVSNDQCNNDYGGAIDDTMMCAGNQHDGGVDSCQGDSGGPLVQKRDGKWVLEGIVSWGEGCAEPGFPGVYSRLSSLVGFVNQIIEENS